jgi:hypothetical protein
MPSVNDRIALEINRIALEEKATIYDAHADSG